MPLNQDLQAALDNLTAGSLRSEGNLNAALSRLTAEPEQPTPWAEAGTVGDVAARVGSWVAEGAAGIADFAEDLPEHVTQFQGRDINTQQAAEAYAAAQAGTATPEQLAYLEQANARGVTPQEMVQSLQTMAGPREDNAFETGLKKLIGHGFDLKDDALKGKTWKEVQDLTLETRIDRSSEAELMNNDSVNEAADNFADSVKQFEDGDMIQGGLNMAKSIGNILAGVSEYAVDNPAEALAMVAGELVPEIYGAGKKGVAGLTAKALSTGGNVSAANSAYTDALKGFIKDEGRMPNQDELEDMRVKAVAIGAMETVADKALAKSGLMATGKGPDTSTLIGKAQRAITGSGDKSVMDKSLLEVGEGIARAAITEGGTETAQAVLAESMGKDVSDLTKEELRAAAKEGAVGALIGGHGKVSGVPLAAATKATEVAGKYAIKGAVKAAPHVASATGKVITGSAKLGLKAATASAKAIPGIASASVSTLAKITTSSLGASLSAVSGAATATPASVLAGAKQVLTGNMNVSSSLKAAAQQVVNMVTPTATTTPQGQPVNQASPAQQSFFNVFRSNPEDMSPEEMEALADEDNDLTEDQNTELRAYAKIAKAMKGGAGVVAKETLTGNTETGQPGIQTHIDNVQEGIRNEDMTSAMESLKAYNKWAAYRIEKAKEFRAKLGTKQPIKLKGKVSFSNSETLVKAMEQEAELMQVVLDSLTTQLKAAGATDKAIKAARTAKSSKSTATSKKPLEGSKGASKSTSKKKKVTKTVTEEEDVEEAPKTTKGKSKGFDTSTIPWGQRKELDPSEAQIKASQRMIFAIAKSFGYKVSKAETIKKLVATRLAIKYSKNVVVSFNGWVKDKNDKWMPNTKATWDIAFGVAEKKPVFGFDTKKNQWYQYDTAKKGFTKIDKAPFINEHSHTTGPRPSVLGAATGESKSTGSTKKESKTKSKRTPKKDTKPKSESKPKTEAKPKKATKTVEDRIQTLVDAGYEEDQFPHSEVAMEDLTEEQKAEVMTAIAALEKELKEAMEDADEPIELDRVVGLDIPEYSFAKEATTETEEEAEQPLTLANLVKRFFGAGGNNSALDRIPNIMETLKENPDLISHFDPNWNTAAKEGWEDFTKFYEQFSPFFDEVFTPRAISKGVSYQNQDMLGFLAVDGKLPENVKVALVVAAYEYLLMDAQGSQVKTYDEVKQILGLTDADRLSTKEYNKLKYAGDSSAMLKNKFGKTVIRILNIKPTADAPINFGPNLISSAGAYVLAMLADQEMVQEHPVKTVTYTNSGVEVKDKDVNLVKASMKQVREDVNLKLKDKGFISRIFSTIRDAVMPSTTPREARGKFKGTDQQVPEGMKQAINAYNGQGRQFIKDNVELWNKMSLEAKKAMLGYKPLEGLVKGLRDAQESINTDIDKAIQNMDNFLSFIETQPGGIESTFFFNNIPWVNNRLGMEGAMSTQSNKMLHRFMISSNQWATTVSMDDAERMARFNRTIAEGFDITGDKNEWPKIAKEFEALTKDPEFIEGIAEMQKALKGEEFNEAAITKLTEKGEAKAHTFAAITDYAKFKNAQEAGDTSFTYNLFKEGDGITNGTAFGLLQFASKMSPEYQEQLKRIGLSFDENTEGFAQDKAEGLLDSYEAFQSLWSDSMAQAMEEGEMDEAQMDIFDQVSDVLGSFVKTEDGITSVTKDGRNAAKPILMTFMYGAGIKSLVNNFADTYFQKVYGSIQKFQNSKDPKAKAEAIRIVKAVEAMLGKDAVKEMFGIKKDERMNYDKLSNDQWLNFAFSDRHISDIEKKFQKLYSKPLAAALESNFPDIVRGKQAVEDSMNKAFEVFDAAYKKGMQELRDAIPEDERGIRDISRADERALLDRLKAAMPIIGTFYGQSIEEGLNTMNEEEVKPTNEKGNELRTWKQQPTFTRQVTTNVKGAGEDKQRSSKTANQQSLRKEPSAPRKRGMPMAIHAMDAAVMYMLMQGNSILNVFDAVATGDDKFADTVKQTNQNFKIVNESYSLPSATAAMLERVQAFAEENDIEMSEEFTAMVTEMREMADEFDENRAELIPQVKSWGQYFNGKDTLYKPEGEPAPKKPKEEAETIEEKATNAPKSEPTTSTDTSMFKKYMEQKTPITRRQLQNIIKKLGASQAEGLQMLKDYDTYANDPDFGMNYIVKEMITSYLQGRDPIYFSSEQDTDLDYTPQETVTSANSQKTFDTLMEEDTTNQSVEHTNHLKRILSDIINKVMLPTKMHLAKNGNAESFGYITGEDMYIATGDKTATPVDGHMSPGEVFVHELVHRITQQGVKDPMIRSEVQRLWNIAKKSITPRDLMDDPTLPEDSEEFKVAQQRWNHMFVPKVLAGNKTSNHLEEFLTMGITNEAVMNSLANLKNVYSPIEGSFFEKVQAVVNNILRFIRSSILGTRGKTMDKSLEVLLMDLAGIENDAQNVVAKMGSQAFRTVGNAVNSINNVMVSALDKIEESESYKTLATNVTEAYEKLHASTNPFAEFMASILEEGRGRTGKNGVFHDLKRAINVATTREGNAIKQGVMDAFKDIFTEELDDGDKQALTKMLLKTDCVTVVDAIGFDAAMNVMDKPAELKALQAKLIGSMTHEQAVQAQNLGRLMATGKNALHTAKLNATAIAGKQSSDAKLVKRIDLLASLYAMYYTPENVKLSFFGRTRPKDANDKGAKAIIDMHRQIKADTLTRNFNGAEKQMIKGYIPTIKSPSDGIVGTEKDRERLHGLGYTHEKVMPKDPKDKGKTQRILFVNPSAHKPSYVEGVLSFSGDESKGFQPYDNAADVRQAVVKGKALDAQLFKSPVQPFADDTNLMLPLYNPNGAITNFRYVLDDDTKDTMLAQVTDFDQILAQMSADAVTRQARLESNQKVVDALASQWKEDRKAGTTGSYITISAEKTPDLWFSFTPQVQRRIKAQFGKGELMMRKEHYNLMFGYVKFSMTEGFLKDPQHRGTFEKIVVDTATTLLGKKAGLRVAQAENMLQSFISLAKDVLVVRSGVLIIMNTFSNTMLLAAYGVPITESVTDIGVIPSQIKAYQAAEKKVREYEARLPTATGAARQLMQDKINSLKAEMESNPVAVLLKAGVMTEQFEDVGAKESSMRAGMGALMSMITQKTGTEKPGAFDKAADAWATISLDKGTKGHTMMENAARYSDFIARYTLYNHLVNTQGMTSEAAIAEVMDIFIDYDLPTHKGLQYLNDIGLVMFTKYFIRIQKIIMKTFRERPAGVLMSLMFQNFLNMNEGIWKSTVGVTDPMSRVANPTDFMDMMGADPASQAIGAAVSHVTSDSQG